MVGTKKGEAVSKSWQMDREVVKTVPDRKLSCDESPEAAMANGEVEEEQSMEE